MTKNEMCQHIISIARYDEDRNRRELIEAKVKLAGETAMRDEWVRQNTHSLEHNPYNLDYIKQRVARAESDYNVAKQVLDFAIETFLKMIKDD